MRTDRPWILPLEDRVLLVAAYWHTNLTPRQLVSLFVVSKSAADRIIDYPARCWRCSLAGGSAPTPC